MSRRQSFIYVSLFLILITLPMVVSFFQADLTVSETEKRQLNALPSWQGITQSQSYFDKINEYLNDHFGFREALVTWHNSMLGSIGESPSDTVVIGKNQWYFYKTVDPLTLHTLTDKHQKYRQNLSTRANFIRQRYEYAKQYGFAYVFTVVPNKMTLYREQLPSRYSVVDLTVGYRLFVENLTRDDTKIYFDSFQWLNNVKRESVSPLFYKNDTHWNKFGAYNEAIGLFDFLNNQYGYALKNIQHDFKTISKTVGDLSSYTGLKDKIISLEPEGVILPECTSRRKIQIHQVNRLDVASSECANGNLIVLYLGDSFTTNIYPFISENVNTLFMVRGEIPFEDFKNVIDFVKPDIVIEQKVQRNLPKDLFHP